MKLILSHYEKLYFLPWLLLLLTASSCNPKESTTSESTEIEEASATSKVIETPEESPDSAPKDNIHATEYPTSANSIKTAELVRTKLQQLFKEDLKKLTQ